jgi:hypothetical protein
MAKMNRIQFQPGMSLDEFDERYGTNRAYPVVTQTHYR